MKKPGMELHNDDIVLLHIDKDPVMKALYERSMANRKIIQKDATDRMANFADLVVRETEAAVEKENEEFWAKAEKLLKKEGLLPELFVHGAGDLSVCNKHRFILLKREFLDKDLTKEERKLINMVPTQKPAMIH